jgi:hypothetical protein
MAQELQLKQSDTVVKHRSPWAVALLPFVTLGIYHLVWWYRINREMRDFGAARGYDLGQSPTSSLLALFPGSIIIVPALVSYWRGTKRVQGTARVAHTEPVNGWIALILYIVLAPAYWAYLQVSLNSAWLAEGQPLHGEPMPLEPSEMPPPRLAEPQARPDTADAGPSEPPPPPSTETT